MRNPYEVLGIKENASKDEIRSAYRELAKKYHPDQYGNNPLKDLAEERMREINEAYDMLMKGNTDARGNYSNNSSAESYQSSYNSYQEIRSDIQYGRYAAAEQKLNNIYSKSSQWYYLMGIVQMNKGYYDLAYDYLNTACSMEPMNNEYRQALNYLNNRNTGYRQQYYGHKSSNNSLDCCMKLICLDCLCECLGGDLIPCI